MLKPVGTPAQHELGVEKPTSFERQRTLRDDRLQPPALVVRELPRAPEREMQGATYSGRRAKRDRHPALILKVADVEPRHLRSCESPHRLARRYGPGERHVGVERKRAPVPKLVLRISRTRHEINGDSLGPRENDESRFRVHRFENMREARSVTSVEVDARESAAVTSCNLRVSPACFAASS